MSLSGNRVDLTVPPMNFGLSTISDNLNAVANLIAEARPLPAKQACFLLFQIHNSSLQNCFSYGEHVLYQTARAGRRN